MRAVIQRVREAQVSIAGEIVGQIQHGLLILLGVTTGDTEAEADLLSEKIIGLRIFSDRAGKFAHSVQDVGGSLLIVSQFTLYGDTRKGRRPAFTAAAEPAIAKPLYEYFVARCRHRHIPVATGHFQAHMAVQLVNDGPVTLVLDTAQRGPRQGN